jgi:hypothetical protein
MMTDGRCGQCNWWKTGKESEAVGYCHGAPPTSLNAGQLAVWPMTVGTDYCGAFRSKPRPRTLAQAFGFEDGDTEEPMP